MTGARLSAIRTALLERELLEVLATIERGLRRAGLELDKWFAELEAAGLLEDRS